MSSCNDDCDDCRCCTVLMPICLFLAGIFVGTHFLPSRADRDAEKDRTRIQSTNDGIVEWEIFYEDGSLIFRRGN